MNTDLEDIGNNETYARLGGVLRVKEELISYVLLFNNMYAICCRPSQEGPGARGYLFFVNPSLKVVIKKERIREGIKVSFAFFL